MFNLFKQQKPASRITKRILLVDDEPAILELLKDYLADAQYEIITASDGKQGLAEAQKSMPDLIILDVHMPRMDGFEVLMHLKKDRKMRDIPVFMLTSENSQEAIQRGVQGFAERYLPKPFQADTLLQAIRQTLARF